MSTNTKASMAAKEFAQRWAGDFVGEKQETQSFWNDLLFSLFGILPSEHFLEPEKPVKVDGNDKYIDIYLSSSKVLIEQKGSKVDLHKPIHQSGDIYLTPFEQALRYKNSLPQSEVPLYIVTCNFHTFEVYNMNRPNDPPELIQLANLEKEYYRY